MFAVPVPKCSLTPLPIVFPNTWCEDTETFVPDASLTDESLIRTIVDIDRQCGNNLETTRLLLWLFGLVRKQNIGGLNEQWVREVWFKEFADKSRVASKGEHIRDLPRFIRCLRIAFFLRQRTRKLKMLPDAGLDWEVLTKESPDGDSPFITVNTLGHLPATIVNNDDSLAHALNTVHSWCLTLSEDKPHGRRLQWRDIVKINTWLLDPVTRRMPYTDENVRAQAAGTLPQPLIGPAPVRRAVQPVVEPFVIIELIDKCREATAGKERRFRVLLRVDGHLAVKRQWKAESALRRHSNGNAKVNTFLQAHATEVAEDEEKKDEEEAAEGEEDEEEEEAVVERAANASAAEEEQEAEEDWADHICTMKLCPMGRCSSTLCGACGQEWGENMGSMIECVCTSEACTHWYHLGCIGGLVADLPENIDRFVCPACETAEQKTTYGQPWCVDCGTLGQDFVRLEVCTLCLATACHDSRPASFVVATAGSSCGWCGQPAAVGASLAVVHQCSDIGCAALQRARAPELQRFAVDNKTVQCASLEHRTIGAIRVHRGEAISCGECERWFHRDCLGRHSSDEYNVLRSILRFVCKRCDPSESRTTYRLSSIDCIMCGATQRVGAQLMDDCVRRMCHECHDNWQLAASSSSASSSSSSSVSGWLCDHSGSRCDMCEQHTDVMLFAVCEQAECRRQLLRTSSALYANACDFTRRARRLEQAADDRDKTERAAREERKQQKAAAREAERGKTVAQRQAEQQQRREKELEQARIDAARKRIRSTDEDEGEAEYGEDELDLRASAEGSFLTSAQQLDGDEEKGEEAEAEAEEEDEDADLSDFVVQDEEFDEEIDVEAEAGSGVASAAAAGRLAAQSLPDTTLAHAFNLQRRAGAEAALGEQPRRGRRGLATVLEDDEGIGQASSSSSKRHKPSATE